MTIFCAIYPSSGPIQEFTNGSARLQQLQRNKGGDGQNPKAFVLFSGLVRHHLSLTELKLNQLSKRAAQDRL
jgi:hypothetical protein